MQRTLSVVFLRTLRNMLRMLTLCELYFGTYCSSWNSMNYCLVSSVIST